MSIYCSESYIHSTFALYPKFLIASTNFLHLTQILLMSKCNLRMIMESNGAVWIEDYIEILFGNIPLFIFANPVT